MLGGGCAGRQEEERSGAGWRRVDSERGDRADKSVLLCPGTAAQLHLLTSESQIRECHRL